MVFMSVCDSVVLCKDDSGNNALDNGWATQCSEISSWVTAVAHTVIPWLLCLLFMYAQLLLAKCALDMGAMSVSHRPCPCNTASNLRRLDLDEGPWKGEWEENLHWKHLGRWTGSFLLQRIWVWGRWCRRPWAVGQCWAWDEKPKRSH